MNHLYDALVGFTPTNVSCIKSVANVLKNITNQI